MKIYTKTGDKGKTSLWGGKRVSKTDLRIEAYGTVDEVLSYIGLLASYRDTESINPFLLRIMDRLFTLNASLAADPDNEKLKGKMPLIRIADVESLEKAMDDMSTVLPEMRTFILPGGSVEVAHAHIARTICRRAERMTIRLAEQESVDEIVIIYLNRLSDYLFVLARWIGNRQKVDEIPWIAEKPEA